MSAPLVLFAAFTFLAAWNAGAMTTLQIQHYRIYPLVGRESFAAYVRANNRAAVVPVILPAMLLLVTCVLMLIARPRFLSTTEVALALALNVVQLASTFVWQRPLQAQMAQTGYDETKTKLLVSTNWIRTVSFLAQALLAAATVLRALGSGWS